MKIIRSRGGAALLCAGAAGLIALAIVLPTSAQQNTAKQAKQGKSKYVSPPGYITGVVQGERGPEAGVWVIADTSELEPQMIKTVATDDQGRYLLPELPAVNYQVFVRGYGIADSTPITAKPSATQITLKVKSATGAEAAKVYPGDYWLSMLAPPPASMFPGTGEKSDTNPNGNGLNVAMHSQDEWINRLKSGCNFLAHQLGNTLSRDVTHVFAAKPDLVKTHLDAWEWRLGVGVRGTNM